MKVVDQGEAELFLPLIMEISDPAYRALYGHDILGRTWQRWVEWYMTRARLSS